ncbi:MAG TPA: cytochrome c oxidase subunit I [Acidimicrobiales bacterium]|nr:cytochrome c oxidase subunit I [Acidimicrobiales bacterium]
MAILDRPVLGAPDEKTEERLERRWRDAPGIPGFFTTVDHKRIGRRYIYTSFVFFFLAGLAALVMRDQLASSNNNILAPETYNELFTLHGTTMIFLFNTPVLAGFGNFLIPLQIGARDMAFPRLNAFSYWIFLFAGLFLYSSVLVGHIPDGGWFAYVPLTGKQFSPGINIDFWGLGITFVGISTTVGAVNFIVTIFKMRCPGMTFNRMPIYVWSMLVFSFMVIFAVPAVTIAAMLNELDRLFGTAFYVPTAGGSTLLYQHLFWFWGHPEVYILFVPATGMVSMMVSVFSRRRIAGYVWIVTALVAVGFISFGVWVHHMFATGLPPLALAFFSAASLLITIPSGVQFFAWIATIWKGKVQLTVPMLFTVGFLLIFLLGGITGVMVSMLPFDWAVTDTYFIVAHLHYVLNGAVVFPIFGALYFWAPKITGKTLDERLGKISFWVMFVAFNLTFFPMHVLGMMGMPRRVWTYSNGLGWDSMNLLISVSAVFFGIGTGITLLNWVISMRRSKPAPADPWKADTLEWATSSPPPDWNFAETPVVHSRHPLWEGGVAPVLVHAGPESDDAVRSMGVEGGLEKTSPITSGRDTRASEVLEVPQETAVPLAVAFGVAVFFVGLLINASVVGVLGVAFFVVALLRWVWRTDVDRT